MAEVRHAPDSDLAKPEENQLRCIRAGCSETERRDVDPLRQKLRQAVMTLQKLIEARYRG